MRSDPDLALQYNRDEGRLAAIRAEILRMRIKNWRKNTADTYKTEVRTEAVEGDSLAPLFQ